MCLHLFYLMINFSYIYENKENIFFRTIKCERLRIYDETNSKSIIHYFPQPHIKMRGICYGMSRKFMENDNQMKTNQVICKKKAIKKSETKNIILIKRHSSRPKISFIILHDRT